MRTALTGFLVLMGLMLSAAAIADHHESIREHESAREKETETAKEMPPVQAAPPVIPPVGIPIAAPLAPMIPGMGDGEFGASESDPDVN